MVLMGMQSDCSEKRAPQGQAASLFFQVERFMHVCRQGEGKVPVGKA